MKKYVLVVPNDQGTEYNINALKTRKLFADFLDSKDQSVFLLMPGLTLKIFDTEDGVTPDVEVCRPDTASKTSTGRG